MNKLTLDAPFQGPPAPARRPESRSGGGDRPAPQADPQPQPAAPARDSQQPDGQTGGQTEGRAGARAEGLDPAGLERIAALLRGGEAPLAARGDLVELHNRIARMFTTLNEGLGEMQAQKAAADRQALAGRLDTLEAAVNRMEGALRIEFEPVLKAAVSEALARQARPPRRLRGLALLAAAALAGLAAGAAWQQPLRGLAAEAAAGAAAWAAQLQQGQDQTGQGGQTRAAER
ncbi:hypothetical protein ACUXV3_20460 (plasmid) [Roseobacteraceae bacterium NS-SX3]